MWYFGQQMTVLCRTSMPHFHWQYHFNLPRVSTPFFCVSIASIFSLNSVEVPRERSGTFVWCKQAAGHWLAREWLRFNTTCVRRRMTVNKTRRRTHVVWMHTDATGQARCPSSLSQKAICKILLLMKRGFIVYCSVYSISSQDEQLVTESDVTFYRRPTT